MTAIDWIIIIIYMAAMIGMSVYLGRGQTNDEDYYVVLVHDDFDERVKCLRRELVRATACRQRGGGDCEG